MRRLVSALLLTAALNGCTAEPVDPSSPGSPAGLPALTTSLPPRACSTGGSLPEGNFHRFWPCNTVISIASSGTVPSSVSGGMSTAMALWTDALSAYPGLPTFSGGTSAPHINLTSNGNNGTLWWSGQVTPQTGTPAAINLGPESNVNNQGTALAVSLNELAFVLGIDDNWDHLVDNRAVGVSNQCAFKAGPPVAVDVCAHDLEVVKSLYGMRPSTALPDRFKHIITDIAPSVSSIAVDTGHTAVVSIPVLGFRRANVALCGDTEYCTVPATASNLSMTWQVLPSTTASIAAYNGTSVTIRGNTAGTATLRGTLQSSVFDKAGEFFYGPAVTIPVTVTAPFDARLVGNYTDDFNRIKPSQTCRFMGQPSGGTYQWQRRAQGGIWKFAGSTREIVVNSGTGNFDLRVTVSMNGQSDSDSLSLTVTSSGAICNGY